MTRTRWFNLLALVAYVGALAVIVGVVLARSPIDANGNLIQLHRRVTP